MGVPDVGEKTFVFHKIVGCMCGGCQKKMRKTLEQNHKILSIVFDDYDGKITIQGSNLDPNIVIKELEKIKQKFEFSTEDNPIVNQIEDDQALVHQTDVSSDEASALVVYKQHVHNHLQYIDSPALSTTQHFCSKDNYDHELELKDYYKRFTCDGCKEDGFRKRYRCKHCDYELHEDCMHPKASISHELFGESIFKFSREKPICSHICNVHTKTCEACGNKIHGYSYHYEVKGLYLHPMCVNFKGKICFQGETFTLGNKNEFPCLWCKGNEEGTNYGWAYVSKGTKFQLHVNCVAKIAHEAWKECDIKGRNDAYLMVLENRLNQDLVKNNKGNKWSKCGQLVKIALTLARTIIGIILGDPTALLASTCVELIKK